jgi:hypothetical protein
MQDVMSYDTMEEQRPAKKRRFFAEDSPEKPKEVENIMPQDAAVIADEAQLDGVASIATETGFDASLLESVIGEKLAVDVVQKLRQLSDGNIERGRIRADTMQDLADILQRSIYTSTALGRRRKHHRVRTGLYHTSQSRSLPLSRESPLCQQSHQAFPGLNACQTRDI